MTTLTIRTNKHELRREILEKVEIYEKDYKTLIWQSKAYTKRFILSDKTVLLVWSTPTSIIAETLIQK